MNYKNFKEKWFLIQNVGLRNAKSNNILFRRLHNNRCCIRVCFVISAKNKDIEHLNFYHKKFKIEKLKYYSLSIVIVMGDFIYLI